MTLQINLAVLRGGSSDRPLGEPPQHEPPQHHPPQHSSKQFLSGARQRVTIGRSSRADVCVRDRQAANVHAAIDLTADEATLIDLGSRGGTWVNGERVSEVTLRDADHIQVGGTIVVVGLMDRPVLRPIEVERPSLPLEQLTVAQQRELDRYLQFMRFRDQLGPPSPPESGASLNPQAGPAPTVPTPPVRTPTVTVTAAAVAQQLGALTGSAPAGDAPTGEESSTSSPARGTPEIYDTRRLVAQLRREKRRGVGASMLLFVVLAVGAVILISLPRPPAADPAASAAVQERVDTFGGAAVQGADAVN